MSVNVSDIFIGTTATVTLQHIQANTTAMAGGLGMETGQITSPRIQIWKDEVISLTEIPIGNKTDKRSFPDSWLVSVGITDYSLALLIGN